MMNRIRELMPSCLVLCCIAPTFLGALPREARVPNDAETNSWLFAAKDSLRLAPHAASTNLAVVTNRMAQVSARRADANDPPMSAMTEDGDPVCSVVGLPGELVPACPALSAMTEDGDPVCSVVGIPGEPDPVCSIITECRMGN